MKKIECKISESTASVIKKICTVKGYTYAEFTRRALDAYVDSIINSDGVITSSLGELSKKLGVKFSLETCGLEEQYPVRAKETIGSVMLKGRKDLKQSLEAIIKETEDLEKEMKISSIVDKSTLKYPKYPKNSRFVTNRKDIITTIL